MIDDWYEAPLAEMHAVVQLLLKSDVDKIELEIEDNDSFRNYDRYLKITVCRNASKEGDDESAREFNSEVQSESLNV